MFNAVIPLSQPIIAVQIEASDFHNVADELLARLEIHFMRPVVLVAWDEEARFISRGFPCSEELLVKDDLEWRKFELPQELEVPF